MSQWYYAGRNDRERRGPISLDQLQDLVLDGRLGRRDLVWTEGMADWAAVESVAELSHFRAEVHGGAAVEQPVPNYLWQSIVVTIVCCLPLGIPAIYHASKVDQAVVLGNHRAALASSVAAKNWCTAAFVVGLLTCGVVSVINLAN